MDKKKILSDPVNLYIQTTNHARSNIQTLDKLHTDYLTIRKKLKKLIKKKNTLSRLIGESKREGIPIDGLLDEMKQHSLQIRQTERDLSIISKRILSYFEPKITVEQPDNTVQISRQYTSQSLVTGSCNISLHTNEDKLWNHYICTSSATSIYHRIEWKRLITDVFGHQAYYYMATGHADRIMGILPIIRLNSRLFGDFMVSMPYFNYGGAIADTPEIEQQLIDTANQQAEELGLSHIEYRDDISRSGMPVRTDKVNMILPLPDDDAVLWQGFNAKLRAQIRRAQRESHQVLTGGHNCLQDFYTVFARNMRDLGTPVCSRRFFEQILQTFPQQSKIVVVRLGHRPVAAAFLLAHGERMEIPWASTIRDVNHLSINMLLYWEVLKLATRSGCRFFDFGRSSKDAGTYRFKQQWGAQPQPCYWHYWLPDGAEPPKLNPDNPKYALAIRLWQKLPVWASKLLGPPIVRNLP